MVKSALWPCLKLKNAVRDMNFCGRLALIHITSFSGGKVCAR